jgi:hypothetical protein
MHWELASAGLDGLVDPSNEITELSPSEVRRHSIADDELEPGVFDLVHTRAVLVHLAERDKALGDICTAARRRSHARLVVHR